MEKNYRKTLLACYLGFITQAIIPTAFFLTQLLVDVFCARFVDIIGYRRCIVLSEITSGLGLAGLAVIPDLFADPFAGIMVCVVIYAVGSGLIEVLVSPIVEACPFEHKDAVMSMLHSFYCWGSVGVILLSTLFFAVFGIDGWRWLACVWALIPLYNIYNFATCPIERLTEEGSGLTIRELFRLPIFWLAILLMVCAGASELAMAQWASAFTEAALGFTMPVLLPAGQPVRESGFGADRMCMLRFLGGYHVAGNDQYHVAADSPGRNGAVRAAGHGGGPGRRLRAEPRRRRLTAVRRQPAVRDAGGQRFPVGAGDHAGPADPGRGQEEITGPGMTACPASIRFSRSRPGRFPHRVPGVLLPDPGSGPTIPFPAVPSSVRSW